MGSLCGEGFLTACWLASESGILKMNTPKGGNKKMRVQLEALLGNDPVSYALYSMDMDGSGAPYSVGESM